ncbi:MAG: hypothetical protein AMXMBFR58_17440 [Phycisphaerae bacterium]
MQPRHSFVLLAACAAFLGGTAVLVAGPLDPPAGAITSTGKNLNDVEPRIPIDSTNTPGDANSVYKITSPGSYYLTGNLAGESAKHGIEIASTDVTVDLMGFELQGASASLDGIVVTAAGGSLGAGITIRNGTIKGWGTGDGLDLANGDVRGSIVSDIIARENGNAGIRVGASSTITRCSANYNSQAGIHAGGESTISGCTAEANENYGIYAGAGSSVSSCSVSATTGEVGTGIKTEGGCVISECTSSSNSGDGIETTRDCVIASCVARNNGASGIDFGAGCTVTGCVANGNAIHGLNVGESSIVKGNSCVENAASGISTFGRDTRFEGNNCIKNGSHGFAITSIGNLIISNTCSGNVGTNWYIVAGNSVARIVNTTTNATDIDGSTYAGGLGTTEPLANCTY